MSGPALSGTLGLLAGYLLRTSAVLALALVAAAAARRRPAALRHFILSSALIGLLLLPLLRIAPVGWRSSLLPAWMAAAADRADRGGVGEGSGLAPEGTVAERPSGAAPAKADAVEGTRAAGPSLVAGETVARGPASGPLIASGQEARPERGRAARSARGAGGRALDRLIALLWSAGLAVLALRLAVGLAGATRLTAEGVPLAGPGWRALLARFLALVSLRRPVRLKSHADVVVPLTWGWRRPVVLLPAGTEAWSEEERSSALFHELSHIKRGDFLVMLLVRTSLAVFWWNPLGWVVYRRLLREQETACDELVLSAGIKPSSYAASLLAFRRSAGLRWNPSAALLGMLVLGRSSFPDRLAAILKQKLVIKEVKMRTKIMLALALTLAVALVGTARPVPGLETGADAAVLVEAEAPAPFAYEVALAAAGGPSTGPVEQAAVQEKQKEQELKKAKEAEKTAKAKAEAAASAAKTIVIKPAGDEGNPLEIVITEGGEVKTLVLDKPLTITTRKDGGALVLSVDGKDVQVLEGEPVRLTIKEGGIQVLKEGQAVFVGGESGLRIVKEAGKEGRQIVFYGDVKPEVVVEASPEVFVKLGKDIKPGEKWVQVSPQEIKEGKAIQIVTESKPEIAWAVRRFGDTDMLEKVRALQEQVQAIKAKKLDLSALEESLKKLEAELEAAGAKLDKIGVRLEKAPGEFQVIKRIGEDEAESKTGVWVHEKGQASAEGTARVMVGIGDRNERSINMVFTGEKGDAGRADFEKAQAQLKKDLPAGYKIVEQKYDAEKGAMTFKIEAPEGAKTDEAVVRKLVESVKSTLKSAK
jgi:beta-lactamase regulating signal transducer with metallopeptidase domain